MEAGPRDTGRDDTRREADPTLLDGTGEPAGLGLPADPSRLTPDGPDTPDSAEAEAAAGPEFEVELRPQRRLRLWQIAPIAMLAATGSLMFAFPLAFEFGDGGAVVAMLGFLISCCAGGIRDRGRPLVARAPGPRERPPPRLAHGRAVRRDRAGRRGSRRLPGGPAPLTARVGSAPRTARRL